MNKRLGFHFVGAALIVAGAFAMSSTANAQVAGTYSGTTADGSAFSFTLASDPNLDGNLELTSVQLSFTATCQTTGLSLPQGWGVGVGDGNDVIGGKLSYTVNFDQLYAPITFSFKGNTVKGQLSERVAALIAGTPPKKAEICTVPNQPYSATNTGGTTKSTGNTLNNIPHIQFTPPNTRH